MGEGRQTNRNIHRATKHPETNLTKIPNGKSSGYVHSRQEGKCGQGSHVGASTTCTAVRCVLHTCSCSAAGVLVPGRGCPCDQPLINPLSACLPGAPCWWTKCTPCDLARRVPGSLCLVSPDLSPGHVSGGAGAPGPFPVRAGSCEASRAPPEPRVASGTPPHYPVRDQNSTKWDGSPSAKGRMSAAGRGRAPAVHTRSQGEGGRRTSWGHMGTVWQVSSWPLHQHSPRPGSRQQL